MVGQCDFVWLALFFGCLKWGVRNRTNSGFGLSN